MTTTIGRPPGRSQSPVTAARDGRQPARYDKLAVRFEATVIIAIIDQWLRAL